jgi:hypothetical protein
VNAYGTDTTFKNERWKMNHFHHECSVALEKYETPSFATKIVINYVTITSEGQKKSFIPPPRSDD